MDEQFHEWGKIKWLWLAALVLSEVVGLAAGALFGGVGMALQIGGAVLLLFLLVFGTYYFLRRSRARARRQMFSTAIQAQTAIAPRSVNDPNERAALDRLRQKFQAGLGEFTSRGRDIYKLPWHLIIGEPGSGKTEAIRHSGIDFPPGLQNELQGSGGTVNMDWWFTNHGVMLDTAGRLLFSETAAGQSPEWGEFLKLLKRARSHCPINGLFIVLSVESLIKDSAEKIAQKASRMAQQLDLIQRTLDVRFPVYLLISKCDLLTGFRDFFESIDDPLLQHQMFGWSNPDALDAPFRPDLVDEHLKSVVQKIRRRRLWLLRESFARRLGKTHAAFRSAFAVNLPEGTPRRAEEAEALFALPESILRLAPRLRRYLETIFVSGEWSAKPVFLRGIYFTSSMREGKALDEAIAFATGLPLEQLPEDGDWEKDRAFFLRDLFLDKVFRESGLVTPATNTLKLLRSRLVTVYGSSALAFLLFVAVTFVGYKALNNSVRREAEYWKYGAEHWDAWSPAIVAGPDEQWKFRYLGNESVDCRVPLKEQKPSLIEFHRFLQKQSTRPVTTGWFFEPMAWLKVRGEHDRALAERVLFEQWIFKPLVSQARLKMARPNSLNTEPGTIDRHREALLTLLQLRMDTALQKSGSSASLDTIRAERCLRALLSYLSGHDSSVEPELVAALANAYSNATGKSEWPPEDPLAGDSLASDSALEMGLTEFQSATSHAQTNIFKELAALDRLVDDLSAFQRDEQGWLRSANPSCQELTRNLAPAMTEISSRWAQIRSSELVPGGALTNLNMCYDALEGAASNATAAALLARVDRILEQAKTRDPVGGIVQEVRARLDRSASHAAGLVQSSRRARAQALPVLDRDQLQPVNGRASFEARWSLYSDTCALDANSAPVNFTDIGRQWSRLAAWRESAARLQSSLQQYGGPFADEVLKVCSRVLTAAVQKKGHETVAEYLQVAQARLADLTNGVSGFEDVTRAQDCLAGLERDLEAAAGNSALGGAAQELTGLRASLAPAKRSVLMGTWQFLQKELGFPILASSSVNLTADGLLKCRQLIEDLSGRFTNSVWGSSRELVNEVANLQNNLSAYRKLVASLIDSAGRVTQVHLVPFPWEELATEDKEFIQAVRYIQIPGFVPEADLTRSSTLATLPVDQELSVYFRRTPGTRDPVAVLKRPRWWVLQAILSGEAVPLEGSTENWRVRLPVVSPEQKLKGHFVVDVQFPSGTRLPRKEDWPK